MTENTKKVVVIGDGYVGKTCFVSKITEGKFINNYHVTIGGWQLRAINPVTGGCGTGVKISALGDTLTSHSVLHDACFMHVTCYACDMLFMSPKPRLLRHVP